MVASSLVLLVLMEYHVRSTMVHPVSITTSCPQPWISLGLAALTISKLVQVLVVLVANTPLQVLAVSVANIPLQALDIMVSALELLALALRLPVWVLALVPRPTTAAEVRTAPIAAAVTRVLVALEERRIDFHEKPSAQEPELEVVLVQAHPPEQREQVPVNMRNLV